MTDLQGYLAFVRKHSPYYQELWKDVPLDESTPLDQYPVVEHRTFWEANRYPNNRVLTSPHGSGIVFSTGGTTGQPKRSFLSTEDLKASTDAIGIGIMQAGVRPHDRVANMFYTGNLWGGFLLNVLANLELSVPIVQLPIGGMAEPAKGCQYLEELEATVILSTPTMFLHLAQHLLSKSLSLPLVRLLLFSGEALHDDQRATISQAFPRAAIQPIIYGTNDAGALAYSASTVDSHLYTAAQPSVILEIMPDSKTPTTAVGVPGSMVVTNMTRRLQPVVRYPSGDRAEWVDYEKGIFRLLGRTEIGVRVGLVSMDVGELQEMVRSALPGGSLQALQCVITRQESKDKLTLRVVYDGEPLDGEVFRRRLGDAVHAAYMKFQADIDIGISSPLAVEISTMDELEVNPTSGKLVVVLDKRLG